MFYLYTGITSDLDKRIKEHQMGLGSVVTKKRTPVELAYYEEFSTRILAAKREKEIKGWRRSKKEDLINKRNLHGSVQVQGSLR